MVHPRVEERNLEPECESLTVEVLEISIAAVVGTPTRRVLVFELHEDQAAPVVYLVFDENGDELRELRIHCGHERCVRIANLHARLRGKPLGNASREPLGARVRAQAYDSVHANRFDGRQPHIEVEIVGEVEDVFLRFLRIPKNVALDRVQATALGLDDALAPQLLRYARVVNRARRQERRLALHHEVVVVPPNAVRCGGLGREHGIVGLGL